MDRKVISDHKDFKVIKVFLAKSDHKVIKVTPVQEAHKDL